jgi:hypothetical protein
MSGRWALLPAICGLIAAMHGPADATIYRWVDEDGVVIFSDHPWQYESYRRLMADEATGATRRTTTATAGRPSEAPSAVKTERPRPQSSDSAADEVMRLSGMDVQMELLSLMMQTEFERWRSRLPQIEAAREAVARRLSGDALRAGARRALVQSLDAEHTGLLLAWLRSPLSERMVAMENAASSTERLAEHVHFINQLPESPPSSRRLALLHRLERAEETTPTTLAVIDAAMDGLREAVAPFAPRGTLVRRGHAEVNGATASDEALRFRTMTTLLYTYRNLRDFELERFVSFMESSTGRWFTRVGRTALLEALRPEQDRFAARQPALRPRDPR